MAIAAPTQLATISSNTANQTNWVSGSVTFPTTGQAVLGIIMMGLTNATGQITAPAVTDSGSNTWSVVSFASNSQGSYPATFIAYFLFPSGASDTTVSVTASWSTNTANERFGWLGYTTGHDTSSPADRTGTATPSLVTSMSVTTSGNLTADNELVLVAFTVGNPDAWGTFPGANFTSLYAPVDTVRHRLGGFAYRILTGGSGATTASGTVSWTGGTYSAGSILTVKPASASGQTYEESGIGIAGR